MSHMPSSAGPIALELTRGIVSVKDYGAVGDDTGDDAPAFQAAIAAAAAAVAGSGGNAYGGHVYAPKGQYRIGSQLTIPNGVGLRGAGPSATILKATNGFNAASMITNAAFQEYTFLESLTVDGNESGGAVCSTAVVNLTSMFINSYMRDVIITEGSSVGLRIAADTNGMGPFLVENCWLIRNNGHNLLVEETVANVGAVHGLVFVNLTSEHQPGGKSAIYLKGLGRCQAWAFYNVHIEMTNAGGADTTGITIDGVSRVLLDNVQILSGNAGTIAAGIRITNVAQNIGIQIRNVNNNNVINPILEDLKNSATIAGGNIGVYWTADTTHVGGLRAQADATGTVMPFALKDSAGADRAWVTPAMYQSGNHAGTGAAVAIQAESVNQRALAFVKNDLSRAYGFQYNVNELAFRYITGGVEVWRADSGNMRVVGNIGFYNTAPGAKPTITGSRGGNAALASLLTALATLGLITDSSSA